MTAKKQTRKVSLYVSRAKQHTRYTVKGARGKTLLDFVIADNGRRFDLQD